MSKVVGQWTTPTVTFTVLGANFTEATGIYVTFKTRNEKLTFNNVEVIDDDNVSLTLTQEQTGQFTDDQITVQLNMTYSGGKRAMTYTKRVGVVDNLEDVVL